MELTQTQLNALKADLKMMLQTALREVESLKLQDLEDVFGIESDLETGPQVGRLAWNGFEIAWKGDNLIAV